MLLAAIGFFDVVQVTIDGRTYAFICTADGCTPTGMDATADRVREIAAVAFAPDEPDECRRINRLGRLAVSDPPPATWAAWRRQDEACQQAMRRQEDGRAAAGKKRAEATRARPPRR